MYNIISLLFQNSISEWRVVWFVIAGMFIASSLVFLAVCDASLQPWAHGRSEKSQGCSNGSPDTMEMTVSVSDQKEEDTDGVSFPQPALTCEETLSNKPTNERANETSEQVESVLSTGQHILLNRLTSCRKHTEVKTHITNCVSCKQRKAKHEDVGISQLNCYAKHDLMCVQTILKDSLNFDIEVFSKRL